MKWINKGVGTKHQDVATFSAIFVVEVRVVRFPGLATVFEQTHLPTKKIKPVGS